MTTITVVTFTFGEKTERNWQEAKRRTLGEKKIMDGREGLSMKVI